jgi:hypothetical protein
MQLYGGNSDGYDMYDMDMDEDYGDEYGGTTDMGPGEPNKDEPGKQEGV